MAFINHINLATIREAIADRDPQDGESLHTALGLIDEAIASRADDALIEQARSIFQTGSGPFSDEIEIDDVAGTSPTDTGIWVQAWVWVAAPESEDEDEDEDDLQDCQEGLTGGNA